MNTAIWMFFECLYGSTKQCFSYKRFIHTLQFFQGFQNGVSIRVKIINVQKTELPRSETLRHRQWNPYLYTIEGSIDSIK